uniref:Uncharacterized protein n=1 Tax=Castor canadensis TaxID=51338 RepID=A0A8C0VV32_CASCN
MLHNFTLNNDNHQLGVLTILECRAPRPVPHTPGHCKGSSPFILLQQSHTLPFPSSHQLVHHPGFMGRFSLTRPKPTTGKDARPATWKLGLQGFPEKQSARSWPGALSHRPICVWSVYHLCILALGTKCSSSASKCSVVCILHKILVLNTLLISRLLFPLLSPGQVWWQAVWGVSSIDVSIRNFFSIHHLHCPPPHP